MRKSLVILALLCALGAAPPSMRWLLVFVPAADDMAGRGTLRAFVAPTTRRGQWLPEGTRARPRAPHSHVEARSAASGGH